MRYLMSLLVIISLPAIALEKLTDTEVLKIQAIAGCVDDVYYQGGYEEGDEDRTMLIDTMLSLFELPAYDEEYLYLEVEYDGKLSSEVYYQCISGQREFLESRLSDPLCGPFWSAVLPGRGINRAS